MAKSHTSEHKHVDQKVLCKSCIYTMIRCCVVSPLLSYSDEHSGMDLEVMHGDMRQTVHV